MAAAQAQDASPTFRGQAGSSLAESTFLTDLTATVVVRNTFITVVSDAVDGQDSDSEELACGCRRRSRSCSDAVVAFADSSKSSPPASSPAAARQAAAADKPTVGWRSVGAEAVRSDSCCEQVPVRPHARAAAAKSAAAGKPPAGQAKRRSAEASTKAPAAGAPIQPVVRNGFVEFADANNLSQGQKVRQLRPTRSDAMDPPELTVLAVGPLAADRSATTPRCRPDSSPSRSSCRSTAAGSSGGSCGVTPTKGKEGRAGGQGKSTPGQAAPGKEPAPKRPGNLRSVAGLLSYKLTHADSSPSKKTSGAAVTPAAKLGASIRCLIKHDLASLNGEKAPRADAMTSDSDSDSSSDSECDEAVRCIDELLAQRVQRQQRLREMMQATPGLL